MVFVIPDIRRCWKAIVMPTGFLMLMSFMPQVDMYVSLEGGAVSWKSCKQTILTKSTMEAELTALDTAGSEAEWLRYLLGC